MDAADTHSNHASSGASPVLLHAWRVCAPLGPLYCCNHLSCGICICHVACKSLEQLHLQQLTGSWCLQVLSVSCGMADRGDLLWWQPVQASGPNQAALEVHAWLPQAICIQVNSTSGDTEVLQASSPAELPAGTLDDAKSLRCPLLPHSGLQTDIVCPPGRIPCL